MATFSLRRRLRLYDKLGRFAANGTPVVSALRNLQRRYAKRRDVRAGLFLSMVARVEDGIPVSTTMGAYIPPGERMLIQAGEDAGKIHDGFFKAKQLAQDLQRLKAALIGELMYPVLLFVILCVILATVAIYLVPSLEGAIPVKDWPAFSLGMRALAIGVKSYGIAAAAVLALAVAIALRTLATWRGPLRERLDRWAPPWAIYREIQGSSFLIALAALTGAGQAVTTAVERMGTAASPWLKVHLRRMLRGLVAGNDPGEALRTGLFDREVEDDIEDYARTNNFEDALAKVGQDQVDLAIERIRQRAALLRGAMLLLALGTLLYTYAASILVGVTIAKQAMGMMGH